MHDLFTIGCLILWSLYLIHRGFLQNKIKRIKAGTPKSKIASAPIGDFIEVEGRITCNEIETVRAPLSGVPCASFHWMVEHFDGSYGHGYGPRALQSSTLLTSFFSTPYIYIKDESGAVAAIRLPDCEYLGSGNRFVKVFDNLSEVPPNAIPFLKNKGINFDKGNAIFSKFRIVETYFSPGQFVTAMGTTAASTALKREGAPFHPSKWRQIKKIIHDRLQGSLFKGRERRRYLKELRSKTLSEHGIENFTPTSEQVKIVFVNNEREEGLLGLRKVQVGFEKKEIELKGTYVELLNYLLFGGILFSWGMVNLFSN